MPEAPVDKRTTRRFTKPALEAAIAARRSNNS